MPDGIRHVPVMVEEVMAFLRPEPGRTYLDCTVGLGGHAARILELSSPSGRLVGLDRDAEALEACRERLRAFEGRVELCHETFARLGEVLDGLGVGAVHGVLFDLGVSSLQLDTRQRGFSYALDAPLDMRMDTRCTVTAADLVNRLPQRELATIIKRFGEERWADRIARFIVRRRARAPILTTGQLAQVVRDAVPAGARRTGGHPARRTFQALRIAVNEELEGLERALRAAVDRLAPGGRVCVIAFHSLEDRVVKRTMAGLAAGCVCPPGTPVCQCGALPKVRVLTGKPLTPAPEEVARNPRARSAKLRAAERLGDVLAGPEAE